MDTQPAFEALVGTVDLLDRYRRVRGFSEALCRPLEVDDYQVQSIAQTSPPKWHLAHVTWFYEAFVLPRFVPDYPVFDSRFDYLFNSYYYGHGDMHPRQRRGVLSRPTVEDICRYRAHVDAHVAKLLEDTDESRHGELAFLVTLGLNHEQQHQELLLMDIKHNFSVNSMLPAYRDDLPVARGQNRGTRWVERPGGIQQLGHSGEGFAFDNETPRHPVLLRDHRLADRFVTNGEFMEFIDDGGYRESSWWLSDGWGAAQGEGWRHPLYWRQLDGAWMQFTLGGLRALAVHEPVCHISYYEADAFARWAGKRLPLEAELEDVLAEQPVAGNFVESGLLHPAPADDAGQWFGDLWAWTASPYMPYPGFRPLAGAVGEYNGKFMSNQMVLRGGCCATAAEHVRPSYRNFFYPHERWAFTGLRLAEDG